MLFCAIIKLSNNSHCEILGGIIMLSIPTAQEARKQVDEMQSELGKKKQAEVAEAIKEAIDNLKTRCTISGTLPDALVKSLEDKGYSVQTGGRYNEYDTYISW